MQNNNDELRQYYRRVVPYIPELFNMAHAITGNYDLAEYVLLKTLTEQYKPTRNRAIGLRDILRGRLTRLSLEEAKKARESNTDMTWEMRNTVAPDSPVAQRLFQESTDMRRAVALRVGCNLSQGQIAMCLGVPEANVRDMLAQYDRRLRRSLSDGQRHRAESITGDWMRASFREADATMPSMNTIFRSLQTEVEQSVGVQKKRSFLTRTLGAVFSLLLALLCMVLFWTAAVVIQKQPETASETPVQIEEEAVSQETPPTEAETQSVG